VRVRVAVKNALILAVRARCIQVTTTKQSKSQQG
jgi:hypothetical protein